MLILKVITSNLYLPSFVIERRYTNHNTKPIIFIDRGNKNERKIGCFTASRVTNVSLKKKPFYYINVSVYKLDSIIIEDKRFPLFVIRKMLSNKIL